MYMFEYVTDPHVIPHLFFFFFFIPCRKPPCISDFLAIFPSFRPRFRLLLSTPSADAAAAVARPCPAAAVPEISQALLTRLGGAGSTELLIRVTLIASFPKKQLLYGQ